MAFCKLGSVNLLKSGNTQKFKTCISSRQFTRTKSDNAKQNILSRLSSNKPSAPMGQSEVEKIIDSLTSKRATAKPGEPLPDIDLTEIFGKYDKKTARTQEDDFKQIAEAMKSTQMDSTTYEFFQYVEKNFGELLQDEDRYKLEKMVWDFDQKRFLTELELFNLYPKKVQQWVADAKVPKGYYDEVGLWADLKGQETVDEIHDKRKLEEMDEVDRIIEEEERGEVVVEKVSGDVKREEFPGQFELPADLQHAFRFGVTVEEISPYSTKIKEALSFKYANKPEINDFRKHAAVKKWQREDGDTGSPEVQVAVLTERINYINDHLRNNPKDRHSAYGIAKILAKRKKMLKYLKKTKVDVYYQLMRDLGLKDIVELK